MLHLQHDLLEFRQTKGPSVKPQHPHMYIKMVYNFIKFMARETVLKPHGYTIELLPCYDHTLCSNHFAFSVSHALLIV